MIVLAGWRGGATGGLAAAARLAEALGGRFAWVPRRAGDRGALDVGARPGLLPGGRPVGDAAARGELAEAWGAELPDGPGAGRPGHGRGGRRRRAGRAGPGRGRPGHRDHGPRELAEQALERAFVIAVDHEVNDTTSQADVLLPGVVHAETEGTFTDWEGRVQATHRAVPVGGAAQEIWDLAGQLAARLGADLGFAGPGQAAAETERFRKRPAGHAAAAPAPRPQPRSGRAGRAGTPPAGGWAPDREGSRRRGSGGEPLSTAPGSTAPGSTAAPGPQPPGSATTTASPWSPTRCCWTRRRCWPGRPT